MQNALINAKEIYIFPITLYIFIYFDIRLIFSIKIHSSMKIHHVNRANFAQKIVRCYDQ